MRSERYVLPSEADHTCIPPNLRQHETATPFIRSANRRKFTKDDRSIRFTPEMSLGARYLQKRLGYFKIPFDRVLINQGAKADIDTRRIRVHNKRQWINQMPHVQGNTTKTRRIDGPMDFKNLKVKTASNQQRRTEENDDCKTTNSHAHGRYEWRRTRNSRRCAQ